MSKASNNFHFVWTYVLMVLGEMSRPGMAGWYKYMLTLKKLPNNF
jgi:hypothetical protein